MIEMTILKYLQEALSVPVSAEYLPNEETFVMLEKTSSGEENHLFQATFAFQSYAPKLYDTMKLNEEVKKAMRGAIELSNVSMSKLNTDYRFDDLTHKKFRYQAVFDLVYMEE